MQNVWKKIPSIELDDLTRYCCQILFGNSLTDSKCSFTDQALIKFIIFNKLPVAFFEAKILNELSQRSNTLSQFIKNEKAKLTVRKSHYNIIKKYFKENGFDPILIKSPGYFPYLSDNIDILIPPIKSHIAQQICWNLGYVELPNWEETDKKFFKKFVGAIEVSAIHLHNAIGWDGNRFFDHSEIISINNSDLIILEPHQVFEVILSHAFFENKYFLLGDYYALYYLLRKNKLDLSIVGEQINNHCWNEAFNKIKNIIIRFEQNYDLDKLTKFFSENNSLYTKSVSVPISFGKITSRLFFIKKMFDNPKIKLYKKLEWLFSTIALTGKRILGISTQSPIKFRQKTLLICFSGNDGSGKTTLAQNLITILNKCDMKNHYMWQRIGSSSFILKPIRYIYRLFSKSENVPKSRKARFESLDKNVYLKYFWSFLVIVDFIIRIDIKILIRKFFGGIIILDRYVLDAVNEISSIYNNKELKYFNRILIKFLPKPDVYFFIEHNNNDEPNNYNNYLSNFTLITLDRKSKINENFSKVCESVFATYTNLNNNYHAFYGEINKKINIAIKNNKIYLK